MRLNAAFTSLATVHFDASKFIESPAFGVARFMLDRIGAEKARATTIVRYLPNSKFPEHTHIGGEVHTPLCVVAPALHVALSTRGARFLPAASAQPQRCSLTPPEPTPPLCTTAACCDCDFEAADGQEFMVLEGTFKDQFGAFGAGTYVRNPIDSVHAPWVDDDGCTIMVKLLQMAETGEGTTPLHIDLAQAKERAEPTGFGSSLKLYDNAVTGELVQSYWVNADASIPTDDAAKTGEELFVLAGDVLLDGERFERWDWLRFPPGGHSKRPTLKAGVDGAHLYRKTGHLTPEALAKEKIQITDA